MEKLTYKQAFDKITEAYIKGEIKPNSKTFCFCGTLCGDSSWYYGGGENYSTKENREMELALFSAFPNETTLITGRPALKNEDVVYTSENYEDALFNGMCAALEVLKQIHKERGENVEDFQFEKREIKIISV